MSETLRIGFLPLVDAALPILAHEHGFAEAQGVRFELVRDMSWATVLDRLLYGDSDAAHMIAPLAIATAVGRGRPARDMAVPFVLGLNGNAITFSNRLADSMTEPGVLGDPRAVGLRLKAAAAMAKQAGRALRFGVVHRYSSHNYMLRYWLAESGIRPDQDVEIVTIAPPFAAAALAQGEVDGICVGEPWNSVAVEAGSGRIVLVTAQIWKRGVEKVLALTNARLEQRRDAVERAIRAMRQAGAHFVDPANWQQNSEILARAEYLDGSAERILRTISDSVLLAKDTRPVHVPDFMFQHREAANFPWISQAAWLHSQQLRWEGRAWTQDEGRKARLTFRPDVYRAALQGLDSPLPGASSKVEGALGDSVAVGSTQGRLTLSPDHFFDGRRFDPDDVPGYLSSLPQ